VDIYAINHWDAYIYILGSNLLNLLMDNYAWKSLVVIFSVLAFIRMFPEIKTSGNIVGSALKKIAAVFLFSAFTLWPIKTPLGIYTITKGDTYTNVFKWIVPVDRDEKFQATLTLQTEIYCPPIVALAGNVLGYVQFWTMYIIDRAGQLAGNPSISSEGFLMPAKFSTLASKVSEGIGSIISDLQKAGKWTPEDQEKYASLEHAIKDYFSLKCADPGLISDEWESGDVPSISTLTEHINKELSEKDRDTCIALGEEIKQTTQDFCQRWTEISEDNVPDVCSDLVNLSLWQKIKRSFHSAAEKVKNAPESLMRAFLSAMESVITKTIIAMVGILNFLLLAGAAVIAPISIGVVNLFIFFLCPLFFLTQLVQGNFIPSTVRVLLEMLWARLLYAVFVLAYTFVAALQGAAWKALLSSASSVGILATKVSSEAVAQLVTKELTQKLALLFLKGGGIGLLSGLFADVAFSIFVGILTMWFGPQMLRTIIFGEYLHITQVLDSGREMTSRVNPVKVVK